MRKEQASEAEASFRSNGWNVWAKETSIGFWILYAKPTYGKGLLYAFSVQEMNQLVRLGHVTKLDNTDSVSNYPPDDETKD